MHVLKHMLVHVCIRYVELCTPVCVVPVKLSYPAVLSTHGILMVEKGCILHLVAALLQPPVAAHCMHRCQRGKCLVWCYGALVLFNDPPTFCEWHARADVKPLTPPPPHAHQTLTRLLPPLPSPSTVSPHHHHHLTYRSQTSQTTNQ